jgi:hypothetical protein
LSCENILLPLPWLLLSDEEDEEEFDLDLLPVTKATGVARASSV